MRTGQPSAVRQARPRGSVNSKRCETMMGLTTMLFVPGNDEKKLQKIPTLSADAFILDLEDSVADSVKAEARRRVRTAVLSYGGNTTLYVRVNAFSGDYLYDDLRLVVVPGLRGIVVPKVEGGHELLAIDWALRALERAADIEPGCIEILPLIESVAGLERMDEIASCSRRIRRLGFGNHDFCLDAGLEWPQRVDAMSPTLIHAKSTLVLASRRHRLEPPHDGAYANFRDTAGLLEECLLARRLGFFGKHAIHPGQVETIRNAFRLNAEDMALAREIVARFDASVASGVAAIEVDGGARPGPPSHVARPLSAEFILHFCPGLPWHSVTSPAPCRRRRCGRRTAPRGWPSR
ncbi:MAG: CoA ester lyase, partial [Alicyclobacillus sp.]|nr:CoA ester lyase [Alicyclobacillus sp.]